MAAESTPLPDMAEFLEHLNTDHNDTVSFVARHILDDHTIDNAELTAVNLHGVHVAVQHNGTTVEHTLPFTTPAPSADAVSVAILGLLQTARSQASPTAPLTSLERELTGEGYHTVVGQVTRRESLSPSLNLITIAVDLNEVPELHGDEFFYVLLPPTGHTELTVDASFSWESIAELPDAEQPRGGYYTVRRRRTTQSGLTEIDFWFVLHGEDPATASTWARHTQPGDPVALWGPRRTIPELDEVQTVILVADLSGAAALAATIEQLAPAVAVHAAIEVDSVENACDLGIPPARDVNWLCREDGKNVLLEFVSGLDLPTEHVLALGGGESKTMTAVRRYLREIVGLPPEAVSLQPYWRKAPHANTPNG